MKIDQEKVKKLEDKIAHTDLHAKTVVSQITERTKTMAADLELIAAKHGVKIDPKVHLVEFSQYNPDITYLSCEEMPETEGRKTDEFRLEFAETMLRYFCENSMTGATTYLLARQQEDQYKELLHMVVPEELFRQEPRVKSALYITYPDSDAILSVTVNLETGRPHHYAETLSITSPDLDDAAVRERLRQKVEAKDISLYVVMVPSEKLRLELVLQYVTRTLRERFVESAATQESAQG